MKTYISDIFESGLLLDEDLEILMNIQKLDCYPEIETNRISLKLTATALVTSKLRSIRNRKKYLSLIKELVEILKKISSLNVSIIRFLKIRLESEKKSMNPTATFDRAVADFSRKTSLSEEKHFKSCIESLSIIATYSNDLNDDYSRIMGFNPFETGVHEEKTPLTLEEYTASAIKNQDLHIWLSSKLLCYIGILFCSDCHKLTGPILQSLLDVNFPEMLINLQSYYDCKNKYFQSLRYSINKWVAFKSQRKKRPEEMISSKLKNTLESVIDNLSLISEKSMNVLEEVERNRSSGSHEVNVALIDLRNHTYTAYESLDVLCRLYGILSNTTGIQDPISKPLPHSVGEMENENITIVHHDDTTEPLEENFELYLENEENPEEEPRRINEYESVANLSLMLQELKQSLKQHERFIEAKKRRGSEDREVEIERPKSPPRFNLEILKNELCGETFCAQNETDESKEQKVRGETVILNRSMPPPPPPPIFDLGKLEEEPQSGYNSKSMLDNIKALSGQLAGHEEVYGISD
ncbi:hypothetical protein JTB14_011513 [Gonioctena quinquepunctata]|nr:hypothetical protein JTB14_011513 [Gonioctena quinquepunctata]